jgi:uncharacterized protein (TIRG00374 family)
LELKKSGVVFYISLSTLLALILGLFGILIISKINFIENKFFKKTQNFVKIFKKNFSLDNKKFLFKTFILTFFYWSSRLFAGFFIFNLLGIEISLIFFVFVSLFLLLLGLLPIKTFAGFGMFEGGWAYFLVLAGFEYERVLPIIVNFHLVSLFPVLVYGIVGFLFLKFKK